MSTDPYGDWDAAYVLGALAPAERRAYEAHLTTCDACRAAVGEIAGIPGLLRQVPAQDVTDAAGSDAPDVPGAGTGTTGSGPTGSGTAGAGPTDDVLPVARLADAARRRRARTRAALVGAAAVLAVVAGGTGALVAGAGTRQDAVVAADARTVVLAPVAGSGVSADLTLAPARWGTRLDWSCAYEMAELPEGVYELVLVDADGGRTVVATWTSTGERTATGLHASSALPLDGIVRVELGVVGLERPLAAGDLGT